MGEAERSLRVVSDLTERALTRDPAALLAERTGARVLAEGVETDLHRQRALALGATTGQGWLFGRPVPAARARRPAT